MDKTFDKFMEESIDYQESIADLKMQASTVYTKAQFSPYSPFPSPFDAFSQPHDNSLDR